MQLNGDIFDGVQLTILLDGLEVGDKCLSLVPGVRGLLLHDRKKCGICTRTKPDRGLFTAYFGGLPEEDHIRSRHFQFFNDYGYLLRSMELDAYTAPIVAPVVPGVVDCVVIYNKVHHIPIPALKPLLALNVQYEWNTVTQQLRIRTPKIRSNSYVSRDVTTRRKRYREDRDSGEDLGTESKRGNGSVRYTGRELRDSIMSRI
ncbi:ORF29 [Ictalurid herpesvirus 1]|nr:ORF29 [Ictalurid herpesvirus 1]